MDVRIGQQPFSRLNLMRLRLGSAACCLGRGPSLGALAVRSLSLRLGSDTTRRAPLAGASLAPKRLPNPPLLRGRTSVYFAGFGRGCGGPPGP